jgi:hypothetical protein
MVIFTKTNMLQCHKINPEEEKTPERYGCRFKDSIADLTEIGWQNMN